MKFSPPKRKSLYRDKELQTNLLKNDEGRKQLPFCLRGHGVLIKVRPKLLKMTKTA